MFPVKLHGHLIIIKRPHLPINNISCKDFQKENGRNPKTDTKKQFPHRVTTSLKLLPRKKKTKNYFLRSTKWLSRFMFKPNHSWNKGGGRLTRHGRFASLYPTCIKVAITMQYIIIKSGKSMRVTTGTTQHKVADIYSAHAQLLVFAQQQLHGTVK